MSDNIRYIKSIRLLDHTIGTSYKKYKGVSGSNRLKDREEVRKMVKTICKYIAEELVEREGGVQVKGFGYFFIWKIPRKMTYDIQQKGGEKIEKYNHHTDHHMYSPVYLPTAGARDIYKNWRIDGTFDRPLRRRLKDKIVSGFKYKMYPYSLRKLNTK